MMDNRCILHPNSIHINRSDHIDHPIWNCSNSTPYVYKPFVDVGKVRLVQPTTLPSTISQLTVRLVWLINLPPTRSTPPLLQPIIQHLFFLNKACHLIWPKEWTPQSPKKMFSLKHGMSVEGYSRPLDPQKSLLWIEIIRSQRDAHIKS